MTHASNDNSVRGHVERLGRDIEAMQNAQTGLPAPAAAELADIATRHGELDRRLTDLETRGKPDHHIAGALAADLDGLAQSVRRWIERQDVKAARR
jgi:hypothetical protein